MDQSGRIRPRVPKPNASFPSGLTRPRLVKHRRRVPCAKPEEEDGQTRIIGEKIGTWYPFDPPASTKVPNGTDRSGYDSKGFVFGGSTSFPGSHLRSGAVGEEKGESFGIGRSSGDLGQGVFVFGNNGRRKEKKKSTFNLRRSSSGNFGGVGFKLSEEAGKTRVSNTGTGVGLDRTNVGDSGSGVFGGSSFFSLPDQMRKLNIDKSSSDQWTGKNLGGRPKPDVHEKRPGTFIVGKSFTMFSPTEYSSLPQKFRNLNVGSYDNGVGLGDADNHGACKTDFASEKVEFEFHEGVKKVEETDVCSSDANRKNSFASGSSGKTVNSVDDGIANKLHEKIKKLNIDSSSLKNGESRNKGVEGAGDLFRSSTKKIDGPAQHTSFIKKSTFTDLKDDTFNLNSRSSVCGPNTSEKVENGVPHSQDSMADKFVFSYNDRSSCSNVRNGFHFTATEALFPGVDAKPVSDPDKNLKHNGSNIWNSTIPIFEFQAGSEGVKIDAGSSCFTSSVYCHTNNYATAGLSSPSFVCPASSTADFTSIDNGVGTSCEDYNAASKNASFTSEENIFTGSRHNSAFRAKKGVKESKSKKCSAKSRKSFPVHQRMGLASSDRGSSPKEKTELGSPESYSPMDFSPYDEILVPDTVPGSSAASDESAFDSHHVSINIQRSVSVEEVEDLVSASQHAVVDEGDRKCSKFQENDFKEESECFVDAKSSFFEGEEEDGEEVESRQKDDKISTENSSIYHSLHSHLTKDKFSSSSSTMENQTRDERPNFVFFSGKKDGLNDLNESSFTFSSSATTQGPFSSSKQSHRRKSQTRIAQKSHYSTISGKFNVDATTMNLPPHLNSSLQSETTWKFGNEGVSSISLNSLEEERVPSIKKQEVKQGAVPSTFSSTALSEECEKWRARGNQAYAKGNILKAEEYYTCGVKCVSPSEGSTSCAHALMLCYSNRAAARMSLGRMREALSDCLLAIAIDPSFLKAQVRAANCHLALGETEDASKLYKKCFQLSKGDSSVSKVLEEASDGLQKSQKVAEYVARSNELLQTKAHANLTTVLEMISEAMLISPQFERLIEMKAEALLLLRRYNEVIELCEKTVKSSERNSHLVCADDPSKQEADNVRPFEIWRWHLISRSYFSSGRLEEALQLLQRLVESISEKHGSKSLESFTSFSDTVREMLRLKAAGNTAFQDGRHLEAVEHYTAALACSIESRPFAAICFCNRAAAYQALSQITDAIADCSLAIALDANYLKAISRRATLWEMIRDYDQAKNDLSRLISLVERQGEEKFKKSRATVRPSTPNRDILKNAHVRLASVEEEARKGISLDVYKILGVESSCSAADIKKAYRKAALKHHPDKAGQLLVKGADDSVWGDVSDEVHRDADRLFKMIGEAYAVLSDPTKIISVQDDRRDIYCTLRPNQGEAYTVLSDPTKRMQYDEEEEIRTVVKKNEGMRHKYPGDCQYTRYDRSNSRRQSESPRKPYGSSHYRWSEAAYSSRHYS